MKKIIYYLTLLLTFPLLLTSCTADKKQNDTTVFETTEADVSTNDPNVDASDAPFVIVENYLPENVAAQMKVLFETGAGKFSCFNTGGAPYAIRDLNTISDCVVKSISIPVYRTTTADEKGNFYFSLYEVGNTYEGLKESIRKTHTVAINAQEYGLKENANVFRFITIDLSDYQIELDPSETLAFFSATDTVFPAYISDITETNPAAVLMRRDFGVTGFISRIGTSSMTTNHTTFVFDFELERTYNNKAAYDAELQAEADYQAKLAVVKEAYAGKTLSIIGDSISTFAGISNSVQINSTIGQNAVYNSAARNFNDYTDVYWGRLLTDLDMELGVVNAWSGSFCYGGKNAVGSDNILLRSSQLARNDGTSPDVILVYMGINDLSTNKPEGDLYSILTNGDDSKTQREKVEEWFFGVYAKARRTEGVVPGETYSGWEEAYALAIRNMQENYPDAEIHCLTLLKNHGAACTDEKLNRFNTCIRAIADYFGVGLVDQNASELNKTYFNNSVDGTGLHPDIRGHKAMARVIVETLYNELQS